MRVLVTGGAGFIGSHLIDALVARGDAVEVVDDMSAGRPGRLPPQATVHKVSITEGTAVTALVADFAPELICHLAGQIDVRSSVAHPAADAQANVVGTVNVLEAARAAGARVLFASTGAVIYGRDAPIPSMEDVLPLPESPYGVAKHCAEQYVLLYNRLHGTSHAVLRFANVFGPRQDPAGLAGVVAIFCARALAGERPVVYGDGRQTRDYVYIGDAVEAFMAAADSGRPGTWNISTGAEVSVLALTRVISQVAGYELDPVFAPARPGELLRGALASDRARRDLGWTAATPLADGIGRVYRWIEAGSPERAGW
jgi:UDP-glucose 4-epimerase